MNYNLAPAPHVSRTVRETLLFEIGWRRARGLLDFANWLSEMVHQLDLGNYRVTSGFRGIALCACVLACSCGGAVEPRYCDESEGCLHYAVDPGRCLEVTARAGGELEMGSTPDTVPAQPGAVYPESSELFVRWGVVSECEESR